LVELVRVKRAKYAPGQSGGGRPFWLPPPPRPQARLATHTLLSRVWAKLHCVCALCSHAVSLLEMGSRPRPPQPPARLTAHAFLLPPARASSTPGARHGTGMPPRGASGPRTWRVRATSSASRRRRTCWRSSPCAPPPGASSSSSSGRPSPSSSSLPSKRARTRCHGYPGCSGSRSSS